MHILTIHLYVQTNDAHIMFKEMDKKKKPFILMHCYVEFSKYPKWQTRELETSHKKQKKTVDASPGTATNDPADASSVRTDATSIRTDALEHEKRRDGALLPSSSAPSKYLLPQTASWELYLAEKATLVGSRPKF